jgi:hypothetical protein
MYAGGAVPAPWPIDEVTDTIQSLTARTSREGHATHVWVRFGQGAPTDKTWTIVGDGTAVSWQAPYYVATPPNVVTVNAVTMPMFPYPDPGWSWETNGPVGILHAPPADPPRTAADTISVLFQAAWPSVVVAVDFTYPLYTGVVIDYPDIFDVATAQALADGELARRQGFPQKFTLRTPRVGLQPGQTAALDVPRLGLDTAALVTGVRLTHANNVGPSGTPWWAFDVELVEANASRGNWLTFWSQLKAGGGSGGGTGSSVTGTIPPSPPGGGGTGSAADYATWPLGGDHDAGYPSATGADWQGIANGCFPVTPATFTGRTWTVYATVKRLMGSGTFRLALFTPGQTYHLRGLTSNASTIVGTTGYLEAVRT